MYDVNNGPKSLKPQTNKINLNSSFSTIKQDIWLIFLVFDSCFLRFRMNVNLYKVIMWVEFLTILNFTLYTLILVFFSNTKVVLYINFMILHTVIAFNYKSKGGR